MDIAFVLPHPSESALLWDLISPVKEAGDRVEFWLPGPVSEFRTDLCPLTCSPARIPDMVIYGVAASGEYAHTDDADVWDVCCHESRIRWLETLCTERRPSLILFPASLAGHELGVRLAARLKRGCFPETIALLREGKRLFARKRVCGSNLDWDAEIEDYPVVLTIAGKKMSWDDGEGETPPMESRPMGHLSLPRWILDYERSEAFPANLLETAPLIFAAGRGLGSRSACERLRRAAGLFGAPLGFSRAAALNGWGGISEIIGQSGLRCGAELCVAVGVSGAAAFMAGIDSVSTLIAVNPDRNAPIFRYADLGITTGAEEFIAALEVEAGGA
ncbi:MAG: FAD-binding protein [Treponema sp.]|nr:FAD-binding protein [Treponema sp.]